MAALPLTVDFGGLNATVNSALIFLRWWFGLTYLAAGIGAVVAAPLMLASGDWGGIYMFVFAPAIATLGWLIHPWGFQRWRSRTSRP